MTDWSDRTTYQGKAVNAGTKALMRAANALVRSSHFGGETSDITMVQGGYNAGGVAASAGTHDGGGAFDLTPFNIKNRIKVFRLLGVAIWDRPTISGLWAHHLHGIVAGDGTASAAAKAQVSEYLAGGDGLRGTAPDPNWRPHTLPIYFHMPTGTDLAVRYARYDCVMHDEPGGYGDRGALAKGAQVTPVAIVKCAGIYWIINVDGKCVKAEHLTKTPPVVTEPTPDPVVVQEVEPTPSPTPAETVTLEVLLLPMAGYNAADAPGVTRWKANTTGLAALVVEHMPDLVGTTELSNRAIDPMRPLFDSLVKPVGIVREPGGTDGRYVYANQATSKHIASGNVSVSNASELNDDDKQAAWSVRELPGGVRKGIISMHTENEDGVDRTSGEDADDLRVDQTFSALGRALTAMAPYGITSDEVIYVGDFNSESMVRDAMVARGWTAVGPGYFTRWDDSAKKATDWAFIKAGSATFERINHAYGDHTALRIVWTTPK